MHFLNHLMNFAGGILRSARQIAHLISNDGKATPRLARARGLDRGIEGKEIGLIGNFANQHGNQFHASRALRQIVDGVIELQHLVADRVDPAGDVLHLAQRSTRNAQVIVG